METNYKPGQNGNRPFNPNNKPAQKPGMNKDNIKRPAINYAQPVITASPTRTFANKKKENERFEEKRAYSKRDLLKRGMLIEDGDEDRVINRKVRTKKKEVEAKGEEIKVAIRNVRRDANDDIKKQKKDGTMTEDEQKSSEKEVQDLTDKYTKQLDKITDAKSKEIMEI